MLRKLSSTLFVLLFTITHLLAKGEKQLNVLDFGAKGDSVTLDTKAFQAAIDKASSFKKKTVVLVPKGYKFLIGSIVLKSNIDLHLQEGSEIRISADRRDYIGDAAIKADGAENLTISGKGYINGQDMKFMDYYETANEWWIPKEWRPNLFELVACNNLEIREITFGAAPRWGLHMIGCERVLIDGIKIRNTLNVPNCDGIDPDHCRDVVIKNCHIECGDDGIVVKATKQNKDYGPSARIKVYDCVIKTQDSGLKIGTESVSDIYDITFERCKIISSCRGLTIQLRDQGSVYRVKFNDITFESKYHSAPWWGRGEGISFTAFPRKADSKIGTIHDIEVSNIKGISENSTRINGCKESRISNITFDNVALTFHKTTSYQGGVLDNRPTEVYEGIEQHKTSGINIRYADDVTLKNTTVKWEGSVPAYFSNALEANNTKGLALYNFNGLSARPNEVSDIAID